MPFFDFHCHPGLKPLFADPAAPVSPWENIRATLRLPVVGNIGINEFFNEVLNSQSSLSQLSNNVKLIGLVLHAPEQNMAMSLSVNNHVKGNKIGLINSDRVKYIAEGTHSFSIIKEELNRLQQKSGNGNTLVILNKSNDFDEQRTGVIYGALIVEGLHCFFNDPVSSNAREEFEANFTSFTNDHKVFAVNLCHIQQNPFCNHAHGIQFFDNRLFYPTGNGISNWGWQVIEKLIEKDILIDVKHMSLWARHQLYTFMQKADNSFKAPLLCTHAGVTGISVNSRIDYFLKAPIKVDEVYEITHLKPRSSHLKDTYYNACSINLYDEDIEMILKSGGLIGLSFDQRILGFANENILPRYTTPHEVEYISKAEASWFLGKDRAKGKVHTNNDNTWLSDDLENYDVSLNPITHSRFFFNNVLHILAVAKEKNIGVKKAAKQICLGTDFDGLINAIDNCKTTTGLQAFKEEALRKFPSLLEEAGLDNEGLDTQEFIEDLFYRNGRDFILKRLK